jgi:hypothetical protein
VSANSTITTARRYYLLKAQATDRDGGFASTWWGKQEGEPGVALPTGFPSKAALAAAHYTTVEDLTGAGPNELAREACLTTKQAEAVLTALAAL